MRTIGCVASLVMLALPAQDDDPRATALDRRVMNALRDRHDSAHARVHYDAASVTEAQRDAAVADIEAGFVELERVLGMHYQGRILVFLYKDQSDLTLRTGSKAAAFSTGTVSLHQPHAFRGVHELTHLFAMQLPRDADSTTDPFVVEGLATMLAKSDEGVPIHDWAALYLQAGRLPDLLELRRTFPDGAPRGVHPYHVAGSFVGFLIDRFGIDKVKSWYVNATEAQHWFGSPVKTLERQWRAWLAERAVPEAHREHASARLGLARTLPESLRTATGNDLLAAHSLDAFAADDATKWTFADGVLRGTHDGPWTHLHTRATFPAKVAVRVRLRMLAGDAVKVRANSAASGANEAIFASWATYLSSGAAFASNDQIKLGKDAWHEIVLVHDAGTCRVWLDGALVLEAANAPSGSAGAVGVGVEKGRVEIAKFEVLDWK